MHCRARRSHASPIQARCYPDDLLSQLQSTLAALADVEFRYDLLREQLDATLEDTGPRDALLQWLNRKQNEECEPLRNQLSDLRERALDAATPKDLPLAS